MEDLQKELEEHKELASNRLMELETLNTQHKEALKLVEKLKMDVSLFCFVCLRWLYLIFLHNLSSQIHLFASSACLFF